MAGSMNVVALGPTLPTEKVYTPLAVIVGNAITGGDPALGGEKSKNELDRVRISVLAKFAGSGPPSRVLITWNWNA